jgi:Uma2 family endonuclease
MSETKAPVAEIKDVPIVVRGPLRMSYDEYLNWEHEGGLTEWVDGEVIIHMPPKDEHQRVVEFLDRLLGVFVELFQLGMVRIAPFTMRALPDGSAREPDLFFLATDNLYRLTSKELNGPADLAIEVISDDSVTRDKDDKFYEYQAAGVKEYWIIDPRPKRLRAEFMCWMNRGAISPFRYRPTTSITQRLFPASG